jgi:SPP1 gp7 family putative phage head morphogenesis protein
MKRNPKRYDPTRTGLLRRRFERDVRVRFGTLRREINAYVALGQPGGPEVVVANARWSFSTTSDGAKRFQDWLNRRSQELILGETGIRDEEGRWTDVHIETAYFRGASQASSNLPSSGAQSGQAPTDWVSDSLRSPVNLNKVQLIKDRAFEKLKGISQDTSIKLGDVLADGIVRGDSPRKVARDMVKEINSIEKRRARTLARTETIRAHAEGSLDAMEQLGVLTVGVDVEWQATMIDEDAGIFEEKVCPLCQELAGMVLPIAEAHGLLPRHPNCRCAWVPSILGSEPKEKRKARIRSSIRAGLSKKARRSKQAARDAIAAEAWVGIDQI